MITTASELWLHWTRKNLLRPQDYDGEVADHVRVGLGDPSISNAHLASAMDAADWDARDLIRVILPVLASFSGMLIDMLALYERVGATTTDKENLRISYEFAPGVALDDRLAPFREKVRRTQTVMAEIEAFQFRLDHASLSPLWSYAHDPLGSGAAVLGIDSHEGLGTFPFASEVPQLDVPDSTLRAVAARHRQVISAALGQLTTFGSTRLDLHDVLHAEPPHLLNENDRDLIHSASDFWAISQIGCLHQLPTIIKSLSPTEADTLIQEHSAWLDGFWRSEVVSVEQQIEDLTDILSLPYWGQRFDLYSAWLAAAMDTALAPHRLIFDVSDGVLAFPFRANLLARILTSRGPVELWSEKRFKASDLIGEGRKNNIQPDFVFVDSATSKVSIAVEAKQYKTANSKNPGRAAHDYAGNLRDANVLVVAHGPLHPNSMDLVAPTDQARVTFLHTVRPGSPAAISRFRNELVELLPPPEAAASDDSEQELPVVAESRLPERDVAQANKRLRARDTSVGTVVLRWSKAAQDLDLHLIDADTGETVNYSNPSAAHADLGPDAFDGGPECAVLHHTGRDIVIEVRLYSEDVAALHDAAPTVTITTLRDSMTLAPRSDSTTSRVWRVATVRANGSMMLHSQSARPDGDRVEGS